MKKKNGKPQIEEIIREESNIFWWLRRDLTTLSVETSDGMELLKRQSQRK